MTGFFDRLASRGVGAAVPVRPYIAPRFAPGPEIVAPEEPSLPGKRSPVSSPAQGDDVPAAHSPGPVAPDASSGAPGLLSGPDTPPATTPARSAERATRDAGSEASAPATRRVSSALGGQPGRPDPIAAPRFAASPRLPASPPDTSSPISPTPAASPQLSSSLGTTGSRAPGGAASSLGAAPFAEPAVPTSGPPLAPSLSHSVGRQDVRPVEAAAPPPGAPPSFPSSPSSSSNESPSTDSPSKPQAQGARTSGRPTAADATANLVSSSALSSSTPPSVPPSRARQEDLPSLARAAGAPPSGALSSDAPRALSSREPPALSSREPRALSSHEPRAHSSSEPRVLSPGDSSSDASSESAPSSDPLRSNAGPSSVPEAERTGTAGANASPASATEASATSSPPSPGRAPQARAVSSRLPSAPPPPRVDAPAPEADVQARPSLVGTSPLERSGLDAPPVANGASAHPGLPDGSVEPASETPAHARREGSDPTSIPRRLEAPPSSPLSVRRSSTGRDAEPALRAAPTHAGPAAPPSIRIHVGQIEIQTEAAPRSRPKAREAPRLSLTDYLRRGRP